MKKGLKNLLYALPIAIGLAGGIKANAQKYIVNPFVQPNDTTKSIVWDNFKTTEEKNVHLDDRLYNYDKTDTLNIPGWVCTDYAKQLSINFHGYGELGFDPEKGLQNNGWHNIPMYTVTLMKPVNFHEINAVMVGNNVGNINEWRFIEPRTDSTYNLNLFNQSEVYKIVIKRGVVVNDDIQGKSLFFQPYLEFIPDGNGGWIDSGWRNPEINLIEKKDTIPPKINRNSPLENEIYNENPKLKYKIIDENFKSAKYSLDNGLTWNNLSQSETKTLNLKNGNYKLLIEAEDYFRLSSRDSVNFYVDKPTGLEDKVVNSKIKVYPNPVNDLGNFEFENPEKKEIDLEIYNSAGQLIGKEKTNDSRINYNFSDYSSGMYLYRLKEKDSEKTMGSGKIIRK